MKMTPDTATGKRGRPVAQTPTAAYQRGWTRAAAKFAEIRQQWNVAFQRIRERAERAERCIGLGPCKSCLFWTMHSPAAAWGYCDMERAQSTSYPAGAWPAPWAHLQENPRPAARRLCTAACFGCVLFKQRG